MNFNAKGITVFAQTAPKNSIDYTKFHAHVEELTGHIEKAIQDKNNGSDILAFNHTRLAFDESWHVVTVTLNNVDNKSNKTLGNALNNLTIAITPGQNKITKENFAKNSRAIIDLSQKVINEVIPPNVLGNITHKADVINDLLAQAVDEYGEGVQNPKVINQVGLQEAQAFVQRAYDMFNNTKPVSDNKDILNIFNNINHSILQHVPQDKIDSMTDQIKDKLSDVLSQKTFSNNGTSKNVNSSMTSMNYISKIRGLLDQILDTYKSGNYAKAKELTVTAYIDNFEFIEKPIGSALQHQGEDLLREKLRHQIDSKVPLDELKSNIEKINKLLDKSASAITH